MSSKDDSRISREHESREAEQRGFERGPIGLRGHQVLAFRAGRCFALTLTARPEQFDRLRPEFEAVLGSFQFLDAVPPATPS